MRKSTSHFWANSADRPRIYIETLYKSNVPRDVYLNSSKSGYCIFKGTLVPDMVGMMIWLYDDVVGWWFAKNKNLVFYFSEVKNLRLRGYVRRLPGWFEWCRGNEAWRALALQVWFAGEASTKPRARSQLWRTPSSPRTQWPPTRSCLWSMQKILHHLRDFFFNVVVLIFLATVAPNIHKTKCRGARDLLIVKVSASSDAWRAKTCQNIKKPKISQTWNVFSLVC